MVVFFVTQEEGAMLDYLWGKASAAMIVCCVFGGIVCLEITSTVMWLTKEVTLEKDSAKDSLKVSLYV